MQNHYSVARTLEELLQELLSKAVVIPQHVTEELKAGRSYASILRKDDSNAELSQKTLVSLENVEMNLLSLAEEVCGREYADGWQQRITSSRAEEIVPVVAAPVFSAGVPRGAYWIRYQTADLQRKVSASALLQQYALETIDQSDGFTLIYGKKEQVMEFLHKMKELTKATE